VNEYTEREPGYYLLMLKHGGGHVIDWWDGESNRLTDGTNRRDLRPAVLLYRLVPEEV
jgi:hypothetical protein